MYRGTTPTLKFTLPFAISTASEIYITFSQSDVTKFELTLSDCTIDGQTITTVLSQANTLALNAQKKVQIQLRVKFTNNKVAASQIIDTTVEKILKEGTI